MYISYMFAWERTMFTCSGHGEHFDLSRDS